MEVDEPSCDMLGDAVVDIVSDDDGLLVLLASSVSEKVTVSEPLEDFEKLSVCDAVTSLDCDSEKLVENDAEMSDAVGSAESEIVAFVCDSNNVTDGLNVFE
jgi:hypothetical protein